MAFTLNRRLAQLVDSNGQLNTGKIPNDYITSDHVADNTITAAMLHTSFTVSTSNLTAIDTDDVSEGSTNLYYTDARVDARLLGNSITSNHSIVADNDGNKVELTTNGSIEITRTAGSPFIDFKDSTSEDYDQRIQTVSGNFNFTADGLSISGSEFIDSSRNIDIGSGTISSGAITSTGEVEATALDINGNGDISGNLTLGGYLAGPATFTIDPAAVGDNTGTVVIAGNLQVDGTTTTINSTTVNVDDLNIQLATGAANAAAADGAGITVDGASATITYDGTNDEWDFNKDINVTGRIVATGVSQFADVNIPDNNAIRFGNSQDLQIYHDGSYSYIREVGTGDLRIAGASNVQIWNSDIDSQMANFANGGAVTLYYGGNPKLATTSTGIDITGTLNTSSSVTMDTSVASGNFLTDATIYPLRLTNDDTTAGNAVALTFGQGGFDFTNFIASVRTGTGDNPKGDLVFGGRPSDGNAFVERMRIQANGHVGIGTSDPDQLFEVKGNGAKSRFTRSGSTGTVVEFYSGGTFSGGIQTNATGLGIAGGARENDLFIKNNGNVGIGTNNPLMKLDIRGGNMQIGGYGGGSDYGIVLTPADSSSYWHIYNDTGGELVFGRNITIGSTEFARFDSTGKLGLGVADPQHQLDISDTISAKIQLSGGTNQNGINFAAAGNDNVLSSQYYLGVGSDLMSSSDYGAVLLDVTNNRSVLLDDQSNSRLGFYNNSMTINSSGNVGIGILSPTLVTGKIVHIHGGAAGVHLTDTASGTTSGDGAYFVFDNPNLYIQQKEAGPMIFETSGIERMRIGSDGLATFTSTRNEWAMRLTSGSNRGGIVLDKPGTSTIMGSMLMLSGDETFRLGTQSYYHVKMDQSGNTYFGNSTNNSFFNSSGNQYFEQAGQIAFESAANDYSNIIESIGYASQSYGTTSRYWNHLRSKGGTHITINTDGGHTGSENNYDDFVIWQGTQDTAEPLFRVSNTGRVIAKQNYEIGNHKTNREEFGVNAINTVDTATSDINTTVTNTYENRSGVYWLNFNSKRFRAFVRPQWMQGRNWVLAAKFFAFNDMPSGSDLWTNDASWNGGDFDLNNGHFSKYGNVWRYFGFNRLAMQMGDRVAPIMQFSSTQTLYGAFSGGRAANGGGVSPSSTDPALSTGATYHGMTNYMGPGFTDLGGLEDKMQSYGLNKWANNATNGTSANNNGSADLNSNTSKGFQLTVEDAHRHVAGNDSVGFAGAWIGCPLDEGNCNPLATSSNGGADSGFGFGGGAGNTARTWTSGIAEWQKGNEVANYLPGYIWLSID